MVAILRWFGTTHPSGIGTMCRAVALVLDDSKPDCMTVEMTRLPNGHTEVTRAHFFDSMVDASEVYESIRDKIVNKAMSERLLAEAERAR